ncbi:MAG: OadG family protein [Lachnospiraceae bacterium]
MNTIFAVSNWWNSVKGPLADAGVNTLIGITVVFLTLLFISFVISLFKYISVMEKNMAAKKAAKTASAKNAEQTVTPVAEQDMSESGNASEMDDLELIAVITAAIHAYEEAQGNAVSGDLVVRSIRKINKTRWQKA